MPNQRISELSESGPLYFNPTGFNSIYTEPSPGNANDEWFLMTAAPKVSNNKISFSNFKKSVAGDALYLKGNQRINGAKTFTDKCYITKRANIHSIQDISSDGPISGYGFVSNTGNFESFSVGSGIEPSGDFALKVFGDAQFEGKLILAGTTALDINYSSSGDMTTQNFRAYQPDVELSGAQASEFLEFDNLEISGSIIISGDLHTTQDTFITNQISGANNHSISFNNDNIIFTSGEVDLLNLSDEKIQIIDKINIDDDTFLNSSNSTPSGKIYIEGSGYTQNINAINNGTYRQIYGGDDESMVFKSNLISGYREFTIELPKTFHTQPVINTQLQHVSGGYIIPSVISNITTHNYKIKFGADIDDDNFSIHTTAMSPSDSELASNKQGMQRFTSTIPSGVDSHTINFPSTHNIKPTLSITMQAENEIVPYTISGVNTSNYTVILSTPTTEQHIVHTISTELDTQRIS